MKAEDSRQVDTDEEVTARNAGVALSGVETNVTTRLRTKAELEQESGLMEAVCERGNLRLAYQRDRDQEGSGSARWLGPTPNCGALCGGSGNALILVAGN
jgi:hypothetical protein